MLHHVKTSPLAIRTFCRGMLDRLHSFHCLCEPTAYLLVIISKALPLLVTLLEGGMSGINLTEDPKGKSLLTSRRSLTTSCNFLSCPIFPRCDQDIYSNMRMARTTHRLIFKVYPNSGTHRISLNSLFSCVLPYINSPSMKNSLVSR